jgi:beta-lactamase class D
MLRIAATIALSFALLGCAGVELPRAQAPVQAAAPAPLATATGIEERSDLRHYFDEQRVSGAFAWFDSASGKQSCTDLRRCRTPYLPASTFKIANAIIALETGVASDPETSLPWDGKEYAVADWNRDHTLRSAIQASCVPCFQAIARKVGQQRMDDWLARLGYGNRDTTGGIDLFWLKGGLRITPLEQIDFLRRLEGGKLPISSSTREFVIDMLALDVGGDHVLRGKTGLALKPEQPMNAGWFVGWLELGERRIFFALLIDGFADKVDPAPLRRSLSERMLRDLELLPQP